MKLEVILTKFMTYNFVYGTEICIAEEHQWYVPARYIKAVYGRSPSLTVLGKVSENYNTKLATSILIII